MLRPLPRATCSSDAGALDDYAAGGSRPRLLELADCIKVDFRQVPERERRALTTELRRRPGRVLLAEKVETPRRSSSRSSRSPTGCCGS